MSTERKDYLLAKITERQNSRDWPNVPQGFEIDAVRMLYGNLKTWFDKRDIRPRIHASKAISFADLHSAVAEMRYLD